MTYDVLIIGGGPGGIYTAWELLNKRPDLKLALFESGHTLERRRCPIDGVKVKSCVHCPTCAIMNGFGGAGAFSDGKYNITNQFGGTLHEHIGKKKALELMEYVDQINMENGGEGTKLYSTGNTRIKKLCLENDLHLLDASVRHLGTDINYVVLEHLYAGLKDRMDIFFDTPVRSVEKLADGYAVTTDKDRYEGRTCVISVGRSGSKWMEEVCTALKIPTSSNRVDIGVRVELPYEVFAHLTDELYESKIVYRTEKFQDRVRTFCMNPKGVVVNENTNGIVTVNGHSYEDPALHTENTNFALLVAKHFSEPFKDSNGYGESIARLSNMLGGGVIVQRFGDLIRGQRSTPKRVEESFVTPTLAATPAAVAIIPPANVYLVLVMPTLPKYTLRQYSTVSVLLMSTDAISPREESVPYSLNMSSTSPVAAELDTRRTRTTGTIWGGICKRAAGILSSSPRKSRKPDALRTPTDTISPTRVGRIPATVFMPSFAPSMKSSSTGRPDKRPKPTI